MRNLRGRRGFGLEAEVWLDHGGVTPILLCLASADVALGSRKEHAR